MLFLMLVLKFKNLRLMFPCIALEWGKDIVEKYDRKTLYLMLLNCYHYLHLLFENVIVD
jgi:hypothetical protein